MEAWSAGVEPHRVDPRAIQVMREADVDISGQKSKHVDELRSMEFDCVITVCNDASTACPRFPGPAKNQHVAFDDPPKLARDAGSEEEAIAHYRRVRDEIRALIETLPGAIGKSGAAGR
jgi:arsenate reductase